MDGQIQQERSFLAPAEPINATKLRHIPLAKLILTLSGRSLRIKHWRRVQHP